MKKFEWSIPAKKHLIFLLHLVFLCTVLTGISHIYLNSNFGRGLSWIREESFTDTFSFKELLEDDIEKIFEYVNYKDVFETEGVLDMDKDMVSVTFNSGKTTIYTLDDMVRRAKSLGYYLDDTFTVQGGPAPGPSSGENSAEPLVNWKTYKPNEVYQEPGDAYASLDTLSKEVLTLLGEYYQIQSNYVDNQSNLYFRVSYMDDNNQEQIYTNAPDVSSDDIRKLGRYLYVSGDSILMDTNMKHVPSNISALLETYRIYDNNNYYIMVGMDTDYPHDDPYSRANGEYNQVRIDYISGLFFLAIGVGGLLITLGFMVWLSGCTTEDHTQIRLHKFDRIPLECGLVLLILAIYLGFAAADRVGIRFLHLVVDKRYWDYSLRLLRAMIAYLLLLAGGFYVIRRYKAGTLWTDTLFYQFFVWMNQYLPKRSFPFHLVFLFIGFWGVNLLLAAGVLYMFQHKQLISLSYAWLIPGIAMAGFNLWIFFLLWRNSVERQKIADAVRFMSDGDTGYQIELERFSGKELELATNVNNIGAGLETALAEKVKSERLKADLITNVSHDIKTPLTSIINYVDLIKREQIQDEKIQRYLEVLEQKSQRLKTLTEDLVEASKASSGNLKLEIARIDFVELIQQVNGEFEEKFALRHLEMVCDLPEQVVLIDADGRRLWRVLENLYNNAFKYAMESSRVYIDISLSAGWVYFTIKNISENPLNIHAEDLTERFVRGDVARTTEGSGLGLSIAKDLTTLQNGFFRLYIDGDLFKVQIGFAEVK